MQARIPLTELEDCKKLIYSDMWFVVKTAGSEQMAPTLATRHCHRRPVSLSDLFVFVEPFLYHSTDDFTPTRFHIDLLFEFQLFDGLVNFLKHLVGHTERWVCHTRTFAPYQDKRLLDATGHEPHTVRRYETNKYSHTVIHSMAKSPGRAGKPSLLNEESSQFRILVERISEFGEICEEVAVSLSGRREQFSILFPGFFGSLVRQSLPTPNTGRLFARRLSLAARAGHGRDLVLLGLFDFETVEFPVLTIRTFPTEARDVAPRRLRPTFAPLSILNERLTRSLSSQPTRVRFAERRGRDGFVNSSTLGGRFEHLEIALVRHRVGGRELRPQRIAAVTTRMVTQPSVDVGDRRDEIHRALPSLPIDGDNQPGIRIREIPNGQCFEFVTTKARVELQRNGGLVAGVATRVQHVLDFVIPAEHVGFVRHRVVTRWQRGGNPRDRGGNVIVVTRPFAEDAQRNAIISIRFRHIVEIVGVVNPVDDLLGSSSISERVGEARGGALGDTDTVTEEFLVTTPGIGFTQELHPAGESQQYVAVGVTAASLARVELVAQAGDFLFAVGITWHVGVPIRTIYGWDTKPLVDNPSPASRLLFSVPQTTTASDTTVTAQPTPTTEVVA